MDADRSDRHLAVGNRLPAFTAVGGAEDTTAGDAHVERARLRGHTGDRGHASAAGMPRQRYVMPGIGRDRPTPSWAPGDSCAGARRPRWPPRSEMAGTSDQGRAAKRCFNMARTREANYAIAVSRIAGRTWRGDQTDEPYPSDKRPSATSTAGTDSSRSPSPQARNLSPLALTEPPDAEHAPEARDR